MSLFWSGLSLSASFFLVLLVALAVYSILTTGIAHTWRRLHPRSPSRLPPGPVSNYIPIFGYVPTFFAKKQHVLFSSLSKRFGKIFTLQLGGQTCVVLNDYETIREAFVEHGEATTGRMQDRLAKEFGFDGNTLGLAEGPMWREHRRFALAVMRNLGMGKSVIEASVVAECRKLAKELEHHANSSEPIDLRIPLATATSNLINSFIFGSHFDISEAEHSTLLLKLLLSDATGQISPFIALPWLLDVPNPVKWMFDKARGQFLDILETIRKLAAKQAAEFAGMTSNDPAADSGSYVEAYIKKQQTNVAQQNFESSAIFTDLQLKLVAGDLFFAGTETTAATLYIAISFLLRHPDYQERVREELQRNVPSDRPVSLEDKPLLPLTDAFLLEVMRFRTIAPIGVFRRTLTHDVVVNGYRLPYNTVLIPNLYAVHMDERLWNEPHRFMPERFIGSGSDGAVTCKAPKYLIPFSLGKRACMGESLAKMDLFVTFANIVRQFRFELPPGEQLPDLEDYKMTLTLSIPRYRVVVERVC